MAQKFKTLRPKAWRPKAWRSLRDERKWLSRLISAIERVTRPEIRSQPDDPRLRARVRARLARPALPRATSRSAYRTRN
ncbi:transcriptional regulator [Bradyrhizobium sp. NP1]|uniref:transcriptional regulator n=1 Tax=Bradyrhizobium sp. NP1 TaxID=3049772 RepID=UPI0025A56674|nr:transcriptional regulator [Bradyrhizobium sp. NP1]WJR75310.1 transcriptional regulator [Bradyrhizobium sp. NP1]